MSAAGVRAIHMVSRVTRVLVSAAGRARHMHAAGCRFVTAAVRGCRCGMVAGIFFLVVIRPETGNEGKDNQQTEDFFHRSG